MLTSLEALPEQHIPKASSPELADIFRYHGQAYRQTHSLPLSHFKVMNAIELCRTEYMGGHLHLCSSCGYEHSFYNSCGNRHCPKCQTLAKVRWLEARKTELLPVPYFHNVFTLPHHLNLLAQYNKKLVYNLLFHCASQTLLEFGSNPKNGLSGKIGFMAILHSWDQKLAQHIHLHCIIPQGALSHYNKHWIHATHPDFLFSVKALSKVFRAKFIDHLQKLYTQEKLIFPASSPPQTNHLFHLLIDHLWSSDWVVYSKKPFAGPEKVLDYLGRYTHRVAISNNRIKKLENGNITFSYRDRRNGDTLKEMTLKSEEFIRRFLLHILPGSYTRIRYFGFLTNRSRRKNLSRCRYLLGLSHELPQLPQQTSSELLNHLIGKDITKCPRCKTQTLTIIPLSPRPFTITTNSGLIKPKFIDTS